MKYDTSEKVAAVYTSTFWSMLDMLKNILQKSFCKSGVYEAIFEDYSAIGLKSVMQVFEVILQCSWSVYL